ncbi:D-glycerate 2-kinase [hydrothermal vent metagenome]|uniref:D-glycerate 2-kinase n=1 Tax=hydrothermal vent metagenome TaxID=652676 RepID=A0A3B0Z1F3_9ZZZZ
MKTNCRTLLLELAQESIASVRGDRLVSAAASRGPDWPVLDVLAIGKAAPAMLAGAKDAFGSRLQRGLLITRQDHILSSWRDVERIEVLTAGHPIPTQASLVAGETLLGWLPGSTNPLLVLLSGGASSLVEVPVPGVTLDVLQHANRWLLGSGLDIHRMNAVRKRLSRIKGGQLLEYLGGRATQVWMISDVRGDDPAVIGSGLLYPDHTNETDFPALPATIKEFLSPAQPNAVSPESIPEHRVLANLQTACAALVKAVGERGLSIQVHDTELDGDTAETGRQLAEILREASPGLHLWAGETTVELPENPGRGGRNQQLALAAAMTLEGRRDCYLLALATDGSDGSSDDAGALVDGGSVARGELAGLDAGASLRAADAGTFHEGSGDLISTGPTGTNVRDIVIAMKIA